MTSIELYQPNQINLKVDFPSSWDDLSMDELKVVARSFFYNTVEPTELFIALLSYRISIAHPKVNISHLIAMLNINDVAMEYAQLIAFLKEKIILLDFPQPLEGFTMPSPGFEEITVGQFEKADLHFNLWLQNDASQLPEFFKAFFNTDKLASIDEILVAALVFIGCKNQLSILFPILFPKQEATEPDEDEEEVEKAPIPVKYKAYDPRALVNLIHEKAGPINGTRHQIRATKLVEFLYECQRNMIDEQNKPKS